MARGKGHIRRRDNGYQLIVGTGRDPITKRYTYVREHVATDDPAVARRALDALIARLDGDRDPGINATVNTLIDRWLAVAELEASTLAGYGWRIEQLIRPVLGEMPLRKLQDRVDILDRFYAHLRRCRNLCDGRPRLDHGPPTKAEQAGAAHACRPDRCRPHECVPAAPNGIRQTHSILRRAFNYAIKWGWMERNPAAYATLPRLSPTEVEPPAVADAVRLLDEAWASNNPDLGLFLWLAIITGARRSELCPLRWSDIRTDERDLLIERAYITRKGVRVIKATKTRKKRRVALDEATFALLTAHRERRRKLVTAAGGVFREDGYIFTRDERGEEPWLPDSVTQAFGRIRDRLSLGCRLHDLRHYSATRLLAGGVDVPTVARRLGHTDGGAITLRVYGHWTRTSDHNAATLLAKQLGTLKDARLGEGTA